VIEDGRVFSVAESRPLRRRRQPPRRNFVSRAALPPKFLWLSRIPAENVHFISQPNIFRHNFGAHKNPINYYILNNVKSVNTAH